MDNIQVLDRAAPQQVSLSPETAAPVRRVRRQRHETSHLKEAAGLRISRVLDILIAGAMLLFTLPLFALVAAAIMANDPGPVIFGHKRVGRDGKSFRCLKFRSMVVDAEARLRALLASDPASAREWALSQKLRGDPRVTPLGVFLRRSSLDELPQLLNVLRGEMSIVGPRPIVESEIVRYGRSYSYYCKVRPGITGLWQVTGRSNVSYGRRVALDRLYVSSKSLNNDLYIILKTIPAVLIRDGSC
jgi:exopolysaccharide production protein ExoY